MDVNDLYSDRHKKAMNFIYGKPLYPEVWEEPNNEEGENEEDSGED